MQYSPEQKKTLKNGLKAIGYKLSIKTTYSCFSGKAFEHLSLVTPQGNKLPFDSCTVYARAQYDEHKAAFMFLNDALKSFQTI